MKPKKPINIKNFDKFLNKDEGLESTYFWNKHEDDERDELLIYENIGENWFGEGITAKGVKSFLKENDGKAVNVRINSPGGLVYDGITIHNDLISHNADVDIYIEGIAASSAAIISQAGTKRYMFENASLMIHRAWTLSIGNESNMKDAAKWLNEIDKQLAITFSASTGLSRDEVMELLIGEVDGTIMGSEESLELGFVDELIMLKKEEEEKEPQPEDSVRKEVESARMKIKSLFLSRNSLKDLLTR